MLLILPLLKLFLDNVCTVPHVVSLLGLSFSPASSNPARPSEVPCRVINTIDRLTQCAFGHDTTGAENLVDRLQRGSPGATILRYIKEGWITRPPRRSLPIDSLCRILPISRMGRLTGVASSSGVDTVLAIGCGTPIKPKPQLVDQEILPQETHAPDLTGRFRTTK